MKTKQHITALAIRPTQAGLIIQLPELELTFKWEDCSPLLAKATQAQRLKAELSPGGYGIHWPDIDEDLSIAGIIRSKT